MVKLAEKERDSLEACKCYCTLLYHPTFDYAVHIFCCNRMWGMKQQHTCWKIIFLEMARESHEIGSWRYWYKTRWTRANVASLEENLRNERYMLSFAICMFSWYIYIYITLMKSLTSCIRENIRESHKTLEELKTVHNKYPKRQEVCWKWILYCHKQMPTRTY